MQAAPHPCAHAPVQLLLACLAWPVDDAARARIRDVAGGGAADGGAEADWAEADWTELLALAARHRVEALVEHALRAAAVPLPAAVAERLGAPVRRSSFLEMAYAREAAGLCARLRAGGLHPLLLKGAATALACYGRLGLKASRDLDLLVPEAEVAPTLALLEAAGFAVQAGEAPHDPRWRRRHKDTVLTRAGSPILIELHWRLFDNPALEPRLAGDAPRTLALYPGGEVETLGADAFFAYLCLHGAQHAWSRLKWLAEFDAFVSGADAAALFVAARDRQARFAAAQAFVLRARLLGKPAPAAVEALYARSRRLRGLVRLALHSALAGGSSEIEERPFGSTPKTVSHYLLAGGPRYWWNELSGDLRGDRVAPGETAPRFGAAGRVGRWLRRLPAALRRDAWMLPHGGRLIHKPRQ